MRILIAFLLVCGSTLSMAQNWCPPGATWKHAMYGFQCVGYSDLIYIGDTVIQSKTCKKINHRFIGYNPMFAPTGTVNDSITNHLTYENNKVIYYFNINSQFDTLFNFNAAIGDKWLRVVSPHGGSCNVVPRKAVEVLDTGSVTLNAVQLRKLVLKYTHVYMSTFTTTVIDTVYEKIGSKKNFLFPFVCEGAMVDPDILAGGAFRCYFDNSFGNYNVSSNCNYINNIDGSVSIPEKLVLFPNPTATRFKLQGDFIMNTIRVFDVCGKEKQINIIDDEVDVSALDCGIYFVAVISGQGNIVRGRFVKL